MTQFDDRVVGAAQLYSCDAPSAVRCRDWVNTDIARGLQDARIYLSLCVRNQLTPITSVEDGTRSARGVVGLNLVRCQHCSRISLPCLAKVSSMLGGE